MTEQSVNERPILQAVEQRREYVNDAIVEDLPVKKPERLYEATRYLLDAGGKRLRPVLLLLAAESIMDVDVEDVDYRAFPTKNGNTVDVMSAAIALEVIQSFTLIHDDIMDDDDLRRGVPSVHREYDLETAILAGDTLYSKAFEFMTATGATPERTVRAINRLACTCTEICEGQSLDVAFETRSDVAEDEYLEMVELKTAVLYAAAASIAGILVDASDDVVEALYQYGLDIGRAFQIQDDVLDLTVPSDKLGKQRGSDLVENKQTVITVHAREHGVDVDELVTADSTETVTEAEIEAAVSVLEDAGSIDYARDMAKELVESGKAALDVLPDNDARDFLFDLADYLIERGY